MTTHLNGSAIGSTLSSYAARLALFVIDSLAYCGFAMTGLPPGQLEGYLPRWRARAHGPTLTREIEEYVRDAPVGHRSD